MHPPDVGAFLCSVETHFIQFGISSVHGSESVFAASNNREHTATVGCPLAILILLGASMINACTGNIVESGNHITTA